MACLITFTAKNEQEAFEISKKLLEEKLIACSNFFPANSLYWWENKIEAAKEFLVILKTEESNFKKIVSRIRKLHSYRLPSIEKINIKTYPEAEKWIKESCKV